MDKQHSIGTLYLDTQFTDEVLATDMHPGLSGIARTKLRQVLDNVLTRHDISGKYIAIRELVLDIDVDAGPDFEYDFLHKVEQQLDEKLSALIGISYISSSNNIEVQTEEAHQIDILREFLQTGIFRKNLNDNRTIQDIFIGCVTNYPAELIIVMRLIIRNQTFRLRLIRQFTNQSLFQLIRAANPADATFIIEYIQRAVELPVEKTKFEASEKREITFGVVFLYLFADKGSRFNRKTFLHYNLEKYREYYKVSFEELISDLLMSMEAISDYSTKSELLQLLTEIKNEQTKSDSTQIGSIEKPESPPHFSRIIDIDEPSEAGQNLDHSKELRSNLALFRSWIKGELSPGNDPEQLRLDITKLLLQPLSRKEFLSELREEDIYRLTALVKPEESPFLILYAKTIEKEKGRGAFDGRAGNEFRLLKWEFIFVALLEERGSHFNQKSFIRSVLFGMASNYNLNPGTLLEYLYRGIIDKESSLPDKIATVLKEIYFEWKEQQGSEPMVSLFDKAAREAQYADELNSFLTTGILVNTSFDGRVYELFRYLKTYRPDLLLNIIEDLKAGVVLDDAHTFPDQNKFYRELIVYVVEEFGMILPGGRKVKSLFGSLADERFVGVDIRVYKTMLAACLRNDPSLLEMAWNRLTGLVEKISLHEPTLFAYLPDEALVGFFDRAARIGKTEFVRSNRNEIYTRIFTSPILSNQLVGQINVSPSAGKLFVETMDEESLQLFAKTLPQPGIGEIPALIIQLMLADGKLIKLLGVKGMATLILDYFKNLQHSSETISTRLFVQACLNKIKPKSKQIEWLTGLQGKISSSSKFKKIETTVQSAIKALPQSKATKPGQSTVNGASTNLVLDRLAALFGKATSTASQSHQAIDAIVGEGVKSLYLEFERVLGQQPELVKEYLKKGNIAKASLTEWLKSAPESLKWKYLQEVSGTYAKLYFNELLLLKSWIEEIFQEHRWEGFQGLEFINLLLDFGAGKYQNLNRQQMIGLILKQHLQNLKPAAQKIFLEGLTLRAEKKNKPLSMQIANAFQKYQSNKKDNMENEALDRPEDLPDKDQEQEDVLENIYISNAGLVLLAPYLPRLFDMLELTVNGNFKDNRSREKGLLALQFLLYENTFFPEHELVLNKILVGYKTGVPIRAEIDFNDQEKELMRSLLMGVIQHWSAIGHTSIQGLRESFLIRNGYLSLSDKGWQLTVEQKAFDILLDRLPWSYSLIKLNWMDKPLYVNWR